MARSPVVRWTRSSHRLNRKEGEMRHRRERYQAGSLTTEKRSNGPDVWVYRWRQAVPNGGTVQRKRIVGTKQEYPTKSAAMKALDGL